MTIQVGIPIINDCTNYLKIISMWPHYDFNTQNHLDIGMMAIKSKIMIWVLKKIEKIIFEVIWFR